VEKSGVFPAGFRAAQISGAGGGRAGRIPPPIFKELIVNYVLKRPETGPKIVTKISVQ
jgi:hypothetical protein